MGICKLNEIDLNAWMVRGGWALHTGSTQTNTQMKRIWLEMQIGIWQGQFENLGNGDVDQDKPVSEI